MEKKNINFKKLYKQFEKDQKYYIGIQHSQKNKLC